MSTILRMGHSLKTDPETEKIREENGYSQDDIPVLESFGLFKDGKPNNEINLSNIDYHAFINWLSKGPTKPIPDIGIKVLCYYKQKLYSGLKSFDITDGMRLQQENLISTIDEMLKNGDDTQQPGAICAKGGASPGTAPTTDCCTDIKKDIDTIKAFVTGIEAGKSSECKLNDETKQQITDIKTGITTDLPALIKSISTSTPGTATLDITGLETKIQAVATITQDTNDKTATLLAQIVDVQKNIQTILSKQNTSTNNLSLQADYDEALAKAEEARTKAETTTLTLQSLLNNPSASKDEIQQAVDEAIKTKIEVEKNIAVALYIYNLDASSSSSAIPVAQPLLINPPKGGAYVGGKRNRKTPANNSKIKEASSKLAALNSAISEAMMKIRTQNSEDPGTPSTDSEDSSGSLPTNNKNAKIQQLTHNLEVKREEVDNLKGTLSLFSKALEVFVNESGRTITSLIQKIGAVPNSNFVIPQLEAARIKIAGLEKNTYSKEQFDKMKSELEKEIQQLSDSVAKITQQYTESQKEVERLRETIAHRDERIAHLQRRIQRRNDTIRDLNSTIETIKADLERTQRELDDCLNKPIPLPEPELEHLRQLIAQKENETRSLTEQLRTKTSEYDKLHEEKEKNTAELEGLKKELAAAKDTLLKKERECLDLETSKRLSEQEHAREINQLKENNKQKKLKITALVFEKNALKSELTQLSSSLENTNIDGLSSELQREIEKLNEQIEKANFIRAQLSLYKQERAFNQENLDAALEAKFLAQRQLAELRALYDASGQEVDLMVQQLAERDKTITKLTESLANDTNKQEFAKQLSDLREIIAARELTIGTIQKEIAEARRLKGEREAELAQIKLTLVEKDKEIQTLRSETDKQKITVSMAIAEITHLKQILSSIMAVLNTVVGNIQNSSNQSGKIGAFAKQISDLQIEKASLERRIESLEKEVASKTELLGKAEVEQTSMLEKINSKNRNISGLQNDLAFAQSSEESLKQQLKNAEKTYREVLAEKNTEYAKLLNSNTKKSTRIESLEAQLQTALAQKVSAEALLKSCKESAEQNIKEHSQNATLIETLQAKVAALEAELLAEKSEHASNISGRNLQLREMQESIDEFKKKDPMNRRVETLEVTMHAQDEVIEGLRKQKERIRLDAEKTIKLLQDKNTSIEAENKRLLDLESEIRPKLKSCTEQIGVISANLEAKTQAEQTYLANIKEKEQLLRTLQQDHENALANIQSQYQEKLAELRQLSGEKSNLEAQIQRLHGQVAEAQQKRSGSTELFGQIQNLNLQKAEIERAYNEEIRKHELTRVALDKKMAECTQKDAEIQHQIRIIQAELATTKGLLMEKEKEITTIKMSKSGQNSIVAQQLARKEQDLLALHANIQLLTTQLSACESSSQLASTYLAEINVLKRTIQDLQNPQSNIRFQRNFPGSSQTQRRNDRRNNFKTKKLTFGSNWNTPSQPSQSSQPIRSAIEMAANREGLAQRLTPGLTEKNFPGLVKIRNNAATSKLSRINRERQEWQKTNPQRNLYIGGTRKNGKPYNTNSTLTILPSASNRKGARMAKSKRNIHPLK